MLDEITPGQLNEWIAFNTLEPIGLEKLYMVLAAVGSRICGMWGAKYEWTDFVPGAKPQEVEQSPELQIAICRAIAARHNAGQKR